MIQPTSGLREQKKAMTRQTIADIALRLTLAKGLNQVTIEEIAREAFVSPRTVTNYFAHKEEAIAAAGSLSTGKIVDQILDRPDDEDPIYSLSEIMVALVTDLSPEDLETYRQKLELAVLYPGVKSYMSAAYLELEEELADALAQRYGLDLSTDLYPRLLAASSIDAFRIALEFWAVEDTDLTLAETIQVAFVVMQDGFPEPLTS